MFSRDYICLVAGLREYTLDSDAKGLDIEVLLSDIYGELSKRDAASLRLLYAYYDCENLAAAYAGRKSHNPLGTLSAESIETIMSGVDMDEQSPLSALPKGVASVVATYLSKDKEDGEDRFDRALFGAYYEACAKSGSKFLRAWGEADRNLRNISAAILARMSGRSIEDVVVGRGEIVGQLLRSSAADFGLRGELGYIDSVIGTLSDESNIVEMEHRIDVVRWDVVEELTQMEYFSADFIFGYLVRVNLILRWRMLDVERGREMFKRLLDDLGGKNLIK